MFTSHVTNREKIQRAIHWVFEALPAKSLMISSFLQSEHLAASEGLKILLVLASLYHPFAIQATLRCKLHDWKRTEIKSYWGDFWILTFHLMEEQRKAPYLKASRPIPMLPYLNVHSIAKPAGFLKKSFWKMQMRTCCLRWSSASKAVNTSPPNPELECWKIACSSDEEETCAISKTQKISSYAKN